MVEVKCSATYCIHNDGNGRCEKAEIFLNDTYTGDPICEDCEE